MEEGIKKKSDFDIIAINEIMQDTYFFFMLLELKRKLKNIESKLYLTMFTKGLAVAFTYELSVCLEKCGILEKDKFFKPNMKSRIRDERQWLHKNICNSSKIKEKISKMGLDFSNRVYDLNVVIKNKKILDINFEQFDEDNDLEFWNNIFYVNELVIKTLFKVLDDECQAGMSNYLYKLTDEYIEKKILHSIKNRINGKRYSYQSYKLFCKSPYLTEIDKTFILYRYRLISSVIFMEKIFSKKELKISISYLFNLDFKNYIRKYKSIVICIVGDELLKMNTKFSNNILVEINHKVDKKFYSINRRMRDNIHYSEISIFSKDEIDFLDKNQNIYLDIIYKHFVDNMNLDINDDDILMTNFLICCREKGLTHDQIKKNFEDLYLKYYYTSKI